MQTAKSIITVKCNKYAASIINALAYGIYTVIIVKTSDDSLSLWTKVLTVATANLIGVFIVKLFEERARKEKLWKIEVTVLNKDSENVHEELKGLNVSHSMVPTHEYTIFNCFASTKDDSRAVKNILTKYRAKYFVTESKIL